MIHMLLAAVLVTAPAPHLQDTGGPDQAEVQRAVKALKEGLKSRDPSVRVQAITANARIADPKVVSELSRGLKDRDLAVVDATIDALRYNPDKSALDQLHKTYKGDKRIKKHEDLMPKLVKAIGQHGDPRSIKVLAADGFGNDRSRVIQARIYSLGNIRHPDAIGALVDLMRSGGRRRIQEYMNDFRIALMILTGQDEGKSQDAWQRWWNENKKALSVSPEPPRLPKADQRRWEYFWGLPRTYERPKRRGERGNDPERGK